MCLIIIKKLLNNIIIMNDSASIVLATSVLALGGLGLYMFRMTHDDDEDNQNNKDVKEDKNNEENIMDFSSLFNWGDPDNKDENKNTVVDTVIDNETEEHEIKPRKKTTIKTQRNRKYTGSSRRRYYQ
jgi:hypothetical protein